MAEARQRAAWARTAEVIAMTANCYRDTKKKPDPFLAADFDPYQRGPKPAHMKADISILKTAFVDRRAP